MTFADAVRAAYRNYATFSGRSRRSEFWWFLAFLLLTYFVLAVAFVMLPRSLDTIVVLAYLAFGLGSLIPYFAGRPPPT